MIDLMTKTREILKRPVGDEPNVTAAPAVATVRTAPWHVRLAAK
jgi:hypothetical protein